MRQTLINKPADMAWLRDTALKDHRPLVERCGSAIIYGNEDSPTRIELHYLACPLANSLPAADFLLCLDGQYRDVLGSEADRCLALAPDMLKALQRLTHPMGGDDEDIEFALGILRQVQAC